MVFTAGDLIKFNFFAWIAVASLLILTLTGWDRFIPKFAIPSEPDVHLKKNIKLNDAVLQGAVEGYTEETAMKAAAVKKAPADAETEFKSKE